MRIAIVGGSGKMGQWFARFLLKEGHQVTLIGRNQEKLEAARQQLGVEIATSFSPAVGSADVILISVPIDSFEEVVSQLQPQLHDKQIIMDVTSIKVMPVAVMHQYLKQGVVLGTHPVFGPGAKDIANQNWVLTPTSEPEAALAQKIKQYLEARGARATLMTPQEHDEMMTVILGLSHFIAIASADAILSLDKLRQMEAIGGSTYKFLLTLIESVISEDPELYASLQLHLPNLTEIEERFLKSAQTWADIVRDKDRPQFVQRMNALKDKLEKSDPNFKQAYQKMYKLLDG